MQIHTTNKIKKNHKDNLYKSLNTFVHESEEGKQLKNLFCFQSFYITQKYISEPPFSNQLVQVVHGW